MTFRQQEIPGVAIIWTWPGTTDFIQHEIRCDLTRAGAVWYTTWVGDTPITPRYATAATGPDEAEQHVNSMRTHQADRLMANRALRQVGYQATEHADQRGDCNCMTCQPTP